jgi:hypothetical protein
MSRERESSSEVADFDPPMERGTERFSNKTGILWALAMGGASAAVLFGTGEALITLRNAGIGLTPISESGIQHVRVILGGLSLLGVWCGWSAAKESQRIDTDRRFTNEDIYNSFKR